jgi:hypothetical protein
MMDAEFKATGVMFLFDLCIFVCYVLLFFAIRGTRGDKNVILPNWQESNHGLENDRFTSRDLRPSNATDNHNKSFNNIEEEN